MKKYSQLDQKERDRIFLLKKQGLTNVEIAKRLGRHKSTIGRELKRNLHQKFKQYLPDTAQRKADKRKALNRKIRYVDIDLNFINMNDFVSKMIDMVSHRAAAITPVASVNVSASTILDLNNL